MRRILIAAAAITAILNFPARADNIIDDWASVKAPPAPQLKPVTIDPKTTALLMLDFLKQNCGTRPRCVATIPTAKKLLDSARAAKMMVVHTKYGTTTFADIVDPSLAPTVGEATFTSFADKFVNTDLEKTLKDKGIKTVIAIGTLANGAVLYTGSGAANRGLNVIIPVDGLSAADTYPEQFTVWQLANMPVFGKNITVTRSDMIKF
jgi:nicotinamidase-related amidase